MKLSNLIEKLAAFEPTGLPFVSLYLNAEANEHGREDYPIWLKKEFSERLNDFDETSVEGKLFAKIQDRINEYLKQEADASANGIAVFAGAEEKDFFEAVQLEVAFPENLLLISDRPHIFPLVRAIESNPKYAVLWADTNKADIYVFGGENRILAGNQADEKVEEIQNTVTNRTQVGGWSQGRYQRHIDNFHLQHAKEVVEELDELMRGKDIEHLILCGDETTIMPILRPQLSKELDEKVVAVLNMSQYDSVEEIRDKTREALGIENATRDKAKVERMFGAAKAAAGLGTMGVEATLAALSNGQVEELVIASDFDAIEYNPKKVEKVLEDYAPGEDKSATDELPEASDSRQIADELVVRALNSAARIVFIEDESLLEEAGGVGAVLRYNINATAKSG